MRDDVSRVFAALSDPTRRSLFERLLERPTGRSATELAQVVNVSRQAIAKHLQVLERSGLATSHRTGREVRYFASSSQALNASAWLGGRAAAWDRRLAELQKRVSATNAQPTTPRRP